MWICSGCGVACTSTQRAIRGTINTTNAIEERPAIFSRHFPANLLMFGRTEWRFISSRRRVPVILSLSLLFIMSDPVTMFTGGRGSKYKFKSVLGRFPGN